MDDDGLPAVTFWGLSAAIVPTVYNLIVLGPRFSRASIKFTVDVDALASGFS